MIVTLEEVQAWMEKCQNEDFVVIDTERQVTLEEVQAWMAKCQKMLDEYFAANYPKLVELGHTPTLVIDKGNRFYKIVKQEAGSRSVFAFIDQNGDVLKPASWRAPAKHARGNLFDAKAGMGSMGPYGPAYLR